MCSNIFYFADLHIYSHTKKNCQGNNYRNRSPLDLYQVHHDIQNAEGFSWWNVRAYFLHEGLDPFIVRVLPRWDLVIHPVSQKLDIIDLTDGLSTQCRG